MPKSTDLQLAVRPDEHVARLHIAMEDAVRMRGVKPPADLDHQVDLALDIRGVRALQVLVERFPFEQFHDDEAALVLPHVVHGDDVRVLPAGPRTRLPVEALARLRIVFEVGHHDLDGDGALHHAVVGAVDDAHRALPEATEIRYRPMLRAGCGGRPAASGVPAHASVVPNENGGHVVPGAARHGVSINCGTIVQTAFRRRSAWPAARCPRARRGRRPSK